MPSGNLESGFNAANTMKPEESLPWQRGNYFPDRHLIVNTLVFFRLSQLPAGNRGWRIKVNGFLSYHIFRNQIWLLQIQDHDKRFHANI
jgi:hypothetical protein